MGMGGVISNLLSSIGKLLPVVTESVQAPSTSSSSSSTEGHQTEAELKALMRMLERINATLYDAEGREIVDQSVKLWLEELKQVAYDAEDVLDEYNYEVLRAQVEAKNASQPDFRKRKQIQILDGMSDQIKDIKDKFDEIEKHRIALRLSDEDGPRRFNSELRMTPTGHFVRESNIFGREVEKEELITMLSSDCDDGEVVHVVTIVGPGGLGKTTLAQLVSNDQRMKQRFDKFGWICVSEDFNVQRLMRETIELITGSTCDLQNLSVLQIKISEAIRGKRILLVLDDVWNEDRSKWESFSEPFMSAKEAKILGTTRNEYVAIIMQTVPSFKLGYISNEHSWRLFKHYAFGEVNQNEDSKFIKIGEKILKKCGNLPLAIKSVACLLKHELEEEKWIDILESEIWDTDKLRDEIFKPLQISYAHLPTYLKPCFLYCSMFPKDHLLQLEELVQMWTSQGYIQSNGKNNSKKAGQEYAKQLWERSFLEGSNGEKEFHLDNSFKLHDVVHDLARLNSGSECYSIDAGNVPEFPSELHHLYIHLDLDLEPPPCIKVAALRTLIISDSTLGMLKDPYPHPDFSKAHKLRALVLRSSAYFIAEWKFKVFPSIVDLKHLRYLSIQHWPAPQCLHSLSFLRTLIIEECYIEDLTKSFGNLVSLEKLVIYDCPKLQKLPTQMGRLTNIQTLKICSTGVSSLPPSLNKIISNIQTFHVRLDCSTIGWLKEFVDIKGTLIIEYLCGLDSVDDGQCANLVSMHNIECLILSFMSRIFGIDDYCDEYFSSNYAKGNQLQLDLSYGKNLILTDEDQVLLMARLQPHPNLKELHIYDYSGITFPKWMRDTTSCASLTRIVIAYCKNLESLSFGSLCRLKYLEIKGCDRLLFLGAESLPLQLQELKIYACKGLISLPGLKKLKSLVKLSITGCDELQTLMMDAEKPSVELTLRINESLHQNSLLGLRNLISLRSLKIEWCGQLQALVDEPRPVESCEVEISDCPGLRDWCSHHNIPYVQRAFK